MDAVLLSYVHNSTVPLRLPRNTTEYDKVQHVKPDKLRMDRFPNHAEFADNNPLIESGHYWKGLGYNNMSLLSFIYAGLLCGEIDRAVQSSAL